MPAIMILGFDLEIGRVMLVALLGALLGILMMIPLRRALIVQQHGVLKYPEGTACAEVLKAGATSEERALGRAGADAPQDVRAARSGAGAIFAGFGPGSSTSWRWRRSSCGRTSPGDLRRAAGGRVAVGGNLAGAARRRLYHRPEDRLDHGRRRRPGLPRPHPGHPFLRSARGRADRAGNQPDRLHGPRRYPRRLYPLYRGRGGGGRAASSAFPFPADDRPRHRRRSFRLGRPAQRDGGQGRAAGAPTSTFRRASSPSASWFSSPPSWSSAPCT